MLLMIVEYLLARTLLIVVVRYNVLASPPFHLQDTTQNCTALLGEPKTT